LIAVFEVLCGIAGLALTIAGVLGMVASDVIPTLWFGFFPLLSIVAGITLWSEFRHAATISILIQLAQVPLISAERFTLNLAVPINFNVNYVWLARNGEPEFTLGVNLIALGLVGVLVIFRQHQRLLFTSLDSAEKSDSG